MRCFCHDPMNRNPVHLQAIYKTISPPEKVRSYTVFLPKHGLELVYINYTEEHPFRITIQGLGISLAANSPMGRVIFDSPEAMDTRITLYCPSGECDGEIYVNKYWSE